MDIEDILKNIKLKEYDIPEHRMKLRRALLNAYGTEEKSNFFMANWIKFAFLSFPILTLVVLTIVIGFSLSGQVIKEYTDSPTLIAEAQNKLEQNIKDEKLKFYYSKTQKLERQEYRNNYEVEYIEERWENTKNYDYKKIVTDLDGKVLEKYMSVDNKSYYCDSCRGVFSELIYPITKNQDYNFDKKSFSTIWLNYYDEDKLKNYPNRASSILESFFYANTLQERIEDFDKLREIEGLEFIREINYKGKEAYSIGYTWQYERIKEEKFVYFDRTGLNYIGSRIAQYVDGTLDKLTETYLENEEFTDKVFDTSTNDLKLSSDRTAYGKGGQLDIYTIDVPSNSYFYDTNEDAERFVDPALDLTFEHGFLWQPRLEEKTVEDGIVEFRNIGRGFYIRAEENGTSQNISLKADVLNEITILDDKKVKIYSEFITEDEPTNFLDLKEFYAIESVFVHNNKTYVFSILVGKKDDIPSAQKVLELILTSIEEK